MALTRKRLSPLLSLKLSLESGDCPYDARNTSRLSHTRALYDACALRDRWGEERRSGLQRAVITSIAASQINSVRELDANRLNAKTQSDRTQRSFCETPV